MNGHVSFPLERKSPSPVNGLSERASNAPVLSEKKQYAQERYYQNHSDDSPLTRQNRLPVHERLGQRNGKKVRFDIPLGTNTFSVLPKHRNYRNHQQYRPYHRYNYGNHYNYYHRQGPRGGISRSFRAQDRLNIIRQHQVISRSYRIENERGPGNRPFRLRRMLPHEIYNQTPDITMRIANPKRFKIQLNPAKQAEIRELQAKSARIVHNLQYKIQEVHATTLKMNHRFSHYT